MDFQAKLKTPFGVIGIRCDEAALSGIDFLDPDSKSLAPQTGLAARVCEQLAAYIANPDFRFDLPLSFAGTQHQRKVWEAMRRIPRGQVRTYGDVAAQIHSSPIAVGQACGENPVPIVIPCHRIVGKSGIGGFSHHRNGYWLDVKCWLLAHEGAL